MSLEDLLEGIDGLQVHIVRGDLSDFLDAVQKEPDEFTKMFDRFRRFDKSCRGTYGLLCSIGQDDKAHTFGVWHKSVYKQAIDFMESKGVSDESNGDVDNQELLDFMNPLLEQGEQVLTNILLRHKEAMATADISDLIPAPTS